MSTLPRFIPPLHQLSTPQSSFLPKIQIMPHHPSEENAPDGIYEKVAKDPSSKTESTASKDEGHKNEHDPINPANLSTGAPGPAIVDGKIISFSNCASILTMI